MIASAAIPVVRCKRILRETFTAPAPATQKICCRTLSLRRNVDGRAKCSPAFGTALPLQRWGIGTPRGSSATRLLEAAHLRKGRKGGHAWAAERCRLPILRVAPPIALYGSGSATISALRACDTACRQESRRDAC